MYAGLILAYLGEAGILHHVWPIIILPFTVAYLNSVVIPIEEERLAQAFGARYRQYRMRVRRWF